MGDITEGVGHHAKILSAFQQYSRMGAPLSVDNVTYLTYIDSNYLLWKRGRRFENLRVILLHVLEHGCHTTSGRGPSPEHLQPKARIITYSATDIEHAERTQTA